MGNALFEFSVVFIIARDRQRYFTRLSRKAGFSKCISTKTSQHRTNVHTTNERARQKSKNHFPIPNRMSQYKSLTNSGKLRPQWRRDVTVQLVAMVSGTVRRSRHTLILRRWRIRTVRLTDVDIHIAPWAICVWSLSRSTHTIYMVIMQCESNIRCGAHQLRTWFWVIYWFCISFTYS